MNVREEIIKTIKGFNKIENIKNIIIILRNNYEEEKVIFTSFEEMPEALSYNKGFGSQELFGRIDFKNGDVMVRAEYDGSESWRYIQKDWSIKLEDLVSYSYLQDDSFDNNESLLE